MWSKSPCFFSRHVLWWYSSFLVYSNLFEYYSRSYQWRPFFHAQTIAIQVSLKLVVSGNQSTSSKYLEIVLNICSIMLMIPISNTHIHTMNCGHWHVMGNGEKKNNSFKIFFLFSCLDLIRGEGKTLSNVLAVQLIEWDSYSLSLVDAIDTLATLGNTTEFARVYKLIQQLDIERDINVSVFETNIRGANRRMSVTRSHDYFF